LVNRSGRFMRLAVATVGLLLFTGPAWAGPELAREAVALVRRACVECHGPEKQKGGLRLDSRAALLKGGENGPPVVPGRPERSELIRRVTLAKGQDGVMPARGEPLGKSELDTLRSWIGAGAPWPAEDTAHWAYVTPARPTPPTVRNTNWPRTAIDRYVLARLEKEGLTPSPEAAKEVLLRRLSFDLVGLPPTPAKVDAFVNDSRPDAYERAVDRLLASPQFGVKWARPWLDAARYADSHGFQRDDLRDLWPYRDWVVRALNSDMPFDRFTIEQLAGDLLPTPTQDQRIATGFLRAAPTNVEAGSDPEDTRTNQVFDRVNTLGTVWLGTTLECAQCHDHKYDPFPTRDYYRLFAFFNSTQKEADRANPKVPGSIRFLGPTMELADPAIDAERKRLSGELNAARQRLAVRQKELTKPDSEWEAATLKLAANAPKEVVLQVTDFDSRDGNTSHEVLKDGSVLLSGEAPDRDTYVVTVKTNLTGIRAIKLEALTDPSLPGTGPGRGDPVRTNFVLGTFAATVAPTIGGKAEPVKFVKARADHSQARFDVAGAIDDNPRTAWAIAPRFRQPHWAVFETAGPLGFDGGTVLTFTLVQDFGAARTIGRLRLSAITGDPGATAIPAGLAEALKVQADKRTPTQAKLIVDYRTATDAAARKLQDDVRRRETALAAVKPPSTLVIRELPTPRKTHVLQRGDFRTPGEEVSPGTPAVLSPLAASRTPSRLDLARWLVFPDNPLTARVTVNRVWAELFGQGLVLTPEDFGIKGERPTHPELLDWLAVEFMDSSWSMKSLLRNVVLSATYRQSSKLTPDLQARDPRNLLLARGPRFRLDAEAIRDNALAIAGLLNPKLGGEPIRPPQPDGLWVKVGGQRYDYVVSPGDEKFRRGLYVIWKRAAPNPALMTFDAADRFACRVKRARSNTPLQALTLLNDPVYVEAALAFAHRVLTDEPDSAHRRIEYAFRLAVARSPRPDEVALLRTLFDAQSEAMARDPAAAKQLVGSFAAPAGVAVAEFAAWYAVCAALLNLDETITKG
jgi:hypothetical protein